MEPIPTSKPSQKTGNLLKFPISPETVAPKKAYPTIKVLYKFCIKVANVVGAFTSFLQDQSKASVRGYAFPKRDGFERESQFDGHCRSYRHSVSKTKLPRFPIPYTNGQTDRQRGRQAGRQAGRQTDRQKDRQTDR